MKNGKPIANIATVRYVADIIGKCEGSCVRLHSVELIGFDPDRDRPGVWAVLRDGWMQANVAGFSLEGYGEDEMYEAGFWKAESVKRVTEWRSEEKLW